MMPTRAMPNATRAPRLGGAWGRLSRRIRRFAASRRGATAVEFALVLPPLLLTIFAIMQISMVFMAGQQLETATAEVARLVRTGQARTYDQATFRATLCGRLQFLIGCDTNLLVDVRKLEASPSLTWPVDASGNFVGTGNYMAAGPGETVLLRAFYQYPVWLPMIGPVLSNLPNGKRLLSASAAFVNEAF